MYFLNSILVILLIILGTLTIYSYLNKRNILPKSKLLVIYLCFLEAIIVLLPHNLAFYFFFDISPFLAYLLNKKKESIILFLTASIYCNLVLNTSIYFYLVYFISIFLIIILSNNTKKYYYLLFIKIFISSFIYFIYVDNSLLSILYIIAVFCVYDLLLKIIYNFIKEENNDYKDDNMLFQVAHEVKNPIAVCKGYLDMLDTNNKDKIDKYIPIIKSEMNRSLNILDEFLNLKRIDISKDLMDFSILLDDVKETMKIVLNEKNINLKIPKIEEELIINGDYDKLKQVLINLIKNSYEADAKNIKIDIKNNDNILSVKVIDDGKGISKSDLSKIGQIFYTTKPTGTGIGVCMSSEIVKLHSGKLIYNSEINKGTIAFIYLPIEYVF